MSVEQIDLRGLGLSEALRAISQTLATCSQASAEAEARMLLLGASGLTRSDVVRDPDRRVDLSVLPTLQSWIARRLAGEPVTRIIGERSFWTLALKVTPDVLDPRPDSETIVIAALDALGARKQEPLRILDLGVGSGALLLALLSECPRATGVGVDLSEPACLVARENASKNGLAARAQIVQGRWSEKLEGGFDVIVSNPPYIETEVIGGLAVEVRAHDPMLALDGGPDGLAAYREIAPLLPGLMRPGSIAVLELGVGKGPAVASLAQAAGLSVVGGRTDLGGVERALVLRTIEPAEAP